ncbi:MAG: hypothetical protein DRQ78_10770 [Epsilonproteobacteria bacterium]|nr:MAG: hypothetical protein DRQ78_10770 [Campylobacterota bacterium]
MIDSSRAYYSPEIFEAMGVATRNDAAVDKITVDGIDNYIYSTFGHESHVLNYFRTVDATGVDCSSKYKKIIDHLTNTYASDPSFQRDFDDVFTMEYGADNASFGTCPDTSWNVYYSIYPPVPFPFVKPPDETVTITHNTFAYEINPGEWYSVQDCILINDEITMVLLDAAWAETATTIQVAIPEDLRTMYLVKYMYNDDPTCVGAWIEAVAHYDYRDEVIGKGHTYRFLIFPIKDNSQFVEHEQYQKVLLNNLGLGNGVLNDSLASDDIAKSIISYSTEFDNTNFTDAIEEVYGPPNNRNSVIFNTKHYVIEYSGSSSMPDGNGDVFTSYDIDFDGYSFDAYGRNAAILPVDIFVRMTMPERYRFLNEIFRLWANTVVVRELEWYETGLFKIFTLIVMAIMAVYTGGTSLAWFVGFKVGIEVLDDVLSPEGLMVLAIIASVVAVGSGAMAGTLTPTNVFVGATKITGNVFKLQHYNMGQDISAEMQKIVDGNEKTKKEMDSEVRKPIYSPYDEMDGQYEVATGGLIYNLYGNENEKLYNPTFT